MHHLSRRNALRRLGLTAGTCLFAGGDPTSAAAPDKKPEEALQENAARAHLATMQGAAWTYHKLESAAVANAAYGLYPDGGCMYAIFASMMQALAKVQPEPFSSFPCHMMKYGGGGVAHWGSICGALNGAAAVIGLLERDKERREALTSNLFTWYEQTALPIYAPKATQGDSPCEKSVANSISCHMSVSRWCKVSGVEVNRAQRKERCRRLTADVATKTIELLNAHLREPCKRAELLPETKTCLACHNDSRHDVAAKMDCKACHQTLSKAHPAVPKADAVSK